MVPTDTRWTVVSEAGKGAHDALAELCRAYRAPVLAFMRRKAPADAEDLAQGFFAEILASDFLAHADPGRGRFRHYLVTAMARYVSKQRRDAATQKRGGGDKPVSLDSGDEDHHAALADHLTPEQVFEQRWQQVVLARARKALRAEYERRNRTERFDRLAPFLRREPDPGEYADVGAALSLSAGAIGSAVDRMRLRYADLVRHEVADTCRIDDFTAEWQAVGLELL